MNCKWDNWSSWSCIDVGFEGCSVGKIIRTRTVAVEANEWGNKCGGFPTQFKEWCNVNCQCLANIPIPPGILGTILRREATNFNKKVGCPLSTQGNIQTIHHCFIYRAHLKHEPKVISNITITFIALIYLPDSAEEYPQVVII